MEEWYGAALALLPAMDALRYVLRVRILLALAAACVIVACGSPQALPKGPPPEYEIEGLDAAPATAPVADSGTD